jgi:hypothetical protein
MAPDGSLDGARDRITRLLSCASRTLSGGGGLPAARAPRAAALLARCAVESYIDDELDRQLGPRGLDHTKAGGSTRVKLVALTVLKGRDSVADLDWCWNTLSTACHHHAYELSPTHHEVEHLIQRVSLAVTP